MDERTTRRRYLLGFGTAGAVGLTGCVSESDEGNQTGGGGGDETGMGNETGTEEATETPTETPTRTGEPDFGGYLDAANNFDGSVADMRGSGEVTVDVGADNGLAFGPAAVHVDNGATVVWEWTGEGGAHNVVSEDDSFGSGKPSEQDTYEHTFEEDGIYTYYCAPHKASGMRAAIVVGTDYPTRDDETQLSQPDRYLDDANDYDGTAVDGRGWDEVSVTVAATDGENEPFIFDPVAIHVDPGTTVVWEWSGDGSSHNVVHDGDQFASGSPKSSGTYERTFDQSGIYNYYCVPHQSLGMKGSIIVGDANTPPYSGQYTPDETPESGGSGGTRSEPDLDGYLDGANNYNGTVTDRTGTVETTVEVGTGESSLGFGPAAIHVDAGATVVWEWTGKGGAHSVVAEDGTFDSGNIVGEAGYTFQYTFEQDGIYTYYCEPHRAVGMRGAVVVGENYPTVE